MVLHFLRHFLSKIRLFPVQRSLKDLVILIILFSIFFSFLYYWEDCMNTKDFVTCSQQGCFIFNVSPLKY